MTPDIASGGAFLLFMLAIVGAFVAMEISRHRALVEVARIGAEAHKRELEARGSEAPDGEAGGDA